MSNDLTVGGNGALTPYGGELQAQMTRMAAERAAEMRTGMQSITCRGGILKVGDDPLPGNQIAAIVLADIRENAFYAERFDPENLLSPTCYAYGRRDEDMAPDPSMQVDLDYFKPQAARCQTCPNNQWGTSDKGKGKACQNRFRLILQSAGYYAPERQGSANLQLNYWDSIDDFAAQDMAILKLPVTSGANWARYVKGLFGAIKKPTLQVVTRIFVTPHEKHQHHFNFELLEELPQEMDEFLISRHNDAMSEIARGYSPPDLKASAQQASGKLRGM